MFRRILVALDDSSAARRGLRAAMALAVDQRAILLAVCVVDDRALLPALDATYVPATLLQSWRDAAQVRARKTLARAEAFARTCGIPCKPVLVETSGSAIADAILEQAQRLRADVIVMGTHGRRGLRRLLMGSDAEAVLREAQVPVLLVRGAYPAVRSHRAPKRLSASGRPVKRRAARARTAPR